VFAQDGIVHGIRLADGHPLWSWPGGQSVYGLWRRAAWWPCSPIRSATTPG
jgi:hypothetical protein